MSVSPPKSLEPAPAGTPPARGAEPGSRIDSRPFQRTIETALVAAVYFIAAKAGLHLAFLHPSATPVWPPTGIAIAALLLWGPRVWPGVFVAALAANLTTAGTVWTSAAIAAGNTLEAAVASLLVSRYAGGRDAFARLDTIIGFAALAALASTMISPTIGVTALALGGFLRWAAYDAVWLTWWLGDVSGALLVTPFLLLWSTAPRLGWSLTEAAERLMYLAALLVVSVAVFNSRFPFGFAIVPFLIWAAFRFGARDAVTAVALVAGIAITGTVHQLGPFAVTTAQTNVSLLYLSVFMGLMAIIVLTISRVVADRAAAADELRRRVVAEEEARRAAEQAGRRAMRLASVTAALSEALTSADVAAVIVDQAVSALGARAGGLGLLTEDGMMETVHMVGIPAETARRWQRFRPEELGIVAACLQTRRPVVLESEADLDAHFPERDMMPEEIRHGARIAVPLVAGSTTIGVLQVIFGGPRRFNEGEIALAQTLGQQGAQAVQRARLYEREHRAAETFQRALLPTEIPQVPGVAIHTVYQPGAREANVGGDWYDVFRLPSGKLVLSIGDVAGRGLAAAVVMGELRQTIRTAALDHEDPAEVLERASQALTLAHGRNAMATAIVAILDPLTSQLSYATAGHPAPVLAAPGGAPAAALPAGGGPLGYLSMMRTPSWTVGLPAGALLVLYTDGLIEQNRDVVEGQEAVIRASRREVAERSSDAAKAILGAVLQGRRAMDDVAIITLAIDVAPFDRFDLTLPAEPASAGVIRQAVRRLARVAALDEKREVDLTIAVGEAVNNTIEHAYRAAEGTVRVLGVREPDEVRVSVIDSGTWRAARAPDGGGRGLALIRDLADSVDMRRTAAGTIVAIGMRAEGRQGPAAAPHPGGAADGAGVRPEDARTGSGLDGSAPRTPVVTAYPRRDRSAGGDVRPVESGVRLRRDEGARTPVVEAFGDLDAATLDALRQALADAARDETGTVVVSLEHARYIDSLTIRQLFEFGRNLTTQRRALALVVPPHSPLARIVTAAGLAAQFQTLGSAAEARAAVEEASQHG
ncbi:MAG TPA: MASE1 domain-containing protein [bacterium]|nr:MASE1 domain-containing protein [bacterium]